jgi:hypothetical protein
LSGGGSLIVNRDNLGDLAKAIGMFSPEDVNLIMRAIAEDAKIQQMKQQIDDETSGLDLAEKTGDGAEGEEQLMEAVAGEGAAGEQPGGESAPGTAGKEEGTSSWKADGTGTTDDGKGSRVPKDAFYN